MNTALITGVAGQDGSYLAEELLSRGYRVAGAVRDVKIARQRLPPVVSDRIELIDCNMSDQLSVLNAINQCRPSEIYNLAAYSSGEGQFDNPAELGDLNGIAVARLLEAIRQVDSQIRLCQASSSEMFGDPLVAPQTEHTEFRPRTPYGAAKLYAHSMVKIYRQKYGIFGCSAILFNHESPRRTLRFVTRKIAHGAASIKLGICDRLRLGNLSSRRDWGFAGDFVRGMWMMLQQSDPDDYVLATGITHSVADLCDTAFRRVGLDFRQYVDVDNTSFRGDENVPIVGDASKAKRKLGWAPSVGFTELVHMMVDAELDALSV